MALGVYPEITLAEARDRCHEARKQVANGIDPSVLRKVRKAAKVKTEADTFQAIGEEWYTLKKAAWSESHTKRNWWLLEKNLFPWIGNRPITQITPPELLIVLRRIEKRGALDAAKPNAGHQGGRSRRQPEPLHQRQAGRLVHAVSNTVIRGESPNAVKA